MSVKINNDVFPIFSQDTESTIKNRYCLNNDTLPRFCVFKINYKKKDKVTNTLEHDGVTLNITSESEYKVNPLEGSDIIAQTFTKFYEDEEIDESSKISFDYSFNNFVIKCMELFGFENKQEVFFAYILITNSDVENEEDYSISYERATEDQYSNYYEDLIKSESDYRSFFETYKKSFIELKNEVERNTKESRQFQSFISKLQTITYPPEVIKTDIKQVEYSFEGTFDYPIDSYDFFNRFLPSNYCPYIRIGKYHKLLNGFRLNTDKWYVEFIENKLEDDENTLQLFVYGKDNLNEMNIEKPLIKDFCLVQIKQISDDKGTFYFTINIFVNDQLDLKEEDLLKRIINLFIIKNIKPNNLTLTKTFGNGYFVIKNFKLPDELFFDFSMNDPDINKFIVIDESYKIHKERGGIKFYITNNNLESSIKCSLIKKTIDVSTQDEIKAFPNILNVTDDVIVIEILKGKSLPETIKYTNLLFNCLIHMVNSSASFYSFYSQYMTKLNLIEDTDKKKKSEKKKKDESNLRLKDIHPDIFISNYPRLVCPKVQPIVISEDDYHSDRKDNVDAMVFPLNKEERDYYSCKHSKQYSFVGLKKNVLPNREKYPYLPCCFVEPQEEDKSSLRFMYEHGIEEKKEEGFNEVISSRKILKERQFGILPDNIQMTFNIIKEDVLIGKSRFLRMGIKQSPLSVLFALLITNKMKTEIKSKNEVFRLSTEDANTIKNKLNELAKYNLASQSGLLPHDITNIIENNLNIDPIFFLEILENIFEVNIIIFCRDRKTSSEGTMCRPDFKRNYILNTNKKAYSRTVILYRTNGMEADIVPYPHTELIVYEKNFDKYDKVGSIQTSFSTSDTFISTLYSMHYSNMNTLYTTYSLKNKIMGQIEDGSGKIRIVYINYNNTIINILTSPCPNFLLNQFDTSKEAIYEGNVAINLNNVDTSKAISFFLFEGVETSKIVVNKTVIGLFGKKGSLEMYIPISININEFSKLSGATSIKDFNINKKELPAPTSLTFSILKQYTSFLRLSNYITAYSQYLFSNLYNDELKVMRLVVTPENQIQKIKELLTKFDERVIINESHNYGELKRFLDLTNENIIDEDTNLILTSNLIKKKIMYYLYIQMKFNLPNLITYKDKRYVDKFYTSSKDFDLSDHYNIFYTLNELRLYMLPIEKPYKVYTEVVDLPSFYYKNNDIEEDTIFRAVSFDTIEKALYGSYMWNKSGNVMYYTDKGISANDVNFILYQHDGEKYEFINNREGMVYKIMLVKFNNEDVKYYSLLSV